LDRQYLQNRIEDYLRKHVDLIERGRERGPDTPDVFPLLQMCVGRVLTNIGMKLDSEVKAIMECALPETRHIYDWLLASKIRGEEWLSRCDDQGRPLKLMKFSSIQQITAEANKAMAKRRGDGFRVPPTAGTEVVHDCGDGWTIVRLLTPEALDYEGAQMGHCVGQGAYDQHIKDDPIYSLRDPMGRSHITIEVDSYINEIRQLKGKQNFEPKVEYTRRLLGWPGLVGLTMTAGECPAGFGVDKQKGLVEIATLEPGDVFDGDLTFVLNKESLTSCCLPQGIRVTGDVTVRRDYFDDSNYDPPDNFLRGNSIDGKVYLAGIVVNQLEVKSGCLHIENCIVEKVVSVTAPIIFFEDSSFSADALENAVIKGKLNVERCRGAVFKSSTRVAGSIHVGYCNTKADTPDVSFADGFHLRGGKELVIDSAFVRFGSTVTVDGHLMIRDGLVEMPHQANVSGNLLVSNSDIDHWPETMNVKGLTVETSVEVGRSVRSPRSPRNAA
jgi:hypothetical protein